jgi:Holliday junction resolvase RusA-like endonuclease
MPKRALKLHVRIPRYRLPRNAWRRQIHAAATKQLRRRAVEYRPEDRLQIDVRLYLSGNALTWHDVDNRLKDVLDALQGRAGGPKAVRSLPALIPNDRQIFRVVIEKCAPPRQSRGYGHLTVSRLRRERA